MKKSHILLAALLACILAAGCSPKTPAPEGAPSAPVSSAESANESGADASSESESQPAEEEKPEPVYASQIKEGTYKIEVSSSSSMFRIVDAQLLSLIHISPFRPKKQVSPSPFPAFLPRGAKEGTIPAYCIRTKAGTLWL